MVQNNSLMTSLKSTAATNTSHPLIKLSERIFNYPNKCQSLSVVEPKYRHLLISLKPIQSDRRPFTLAFSPNVNLKSVISSSLHKRMTLDCGRKLEAWREPTQTWGGTCKPSGPREIQMCVRPSC